MSTPLSRDHFAVTERYTYLNHAATGVLPRVTRDAIARYAQAHTDGGVLGIYPYEDKLPAYRARIAGFIGADADEIAVLRNTSDGANVIALGLDWQPGDRVLLSDNEFPANAIPWLALRSRGVEIDFVDTTAQRLTPDVLRARITPRTRVVAVSWVGFDDGYRHDITALAEVAHARGALLCVDAIQGLGAFAVDVHAQAIDVLFSGGQKWLLSLQGSSFIYVARALYERLRVGAPGWRSVENMWDFFNYDQPLAPGAARFEGGTPSFLGAMALATSIGVLESAPRGAIERHVLGLTDQLVEGLHACGAKVRSLRGPGISSGIVTFEIPGVDSIALGRSMQSEGVVTTWRASGIRVAPHGYNTPADIDLLLRLVPEHATALR